MQYTSAYSLIRPLNLKWKFGLKIFWIITSTLFLGLSVFYIFQVNCLAQEVFLIKNYEGKLSQLSENNETLEIQWAQSSSLENVENYLQNQNFEKATKIKYIRILESSIAKKR